MSNLVKVAPSYLNKIVVNQLGAYVVVGFTAYTTACVLAFHEDKELSKAALLSELYGAAFATWKWYMGLGPEPEVNTGIK